MKRAIQMAEIDHIATVLEDVRTGDEVGIRDSENLLLFTMTAAEDIPLSNKIALCSPEKNDMLVKYGAVIGECTHAITCGHLVHVLNAKSRTVDIPPAFKKEIMRQMDIKEAES